MSYKKTPLQFLLKKAQKKNNKGRRGIFFYWTKSYFIEWEPFTFLSF